MLCSTRILKYHLVAFNLVCAILGGALVWYGAWLLDTAGNMIDNGESTAGLICMTLGFLIIGVAILGTIALYNESCKLLLLSAVFILLLLLVQFIIVSITYTLTTKTLPNDLEVGFDELWDPLHGDNSTLQPYEEWLECCGKNGPQDYFHLDKIPTESCCKDRDCTIILNLYIEGCELKYREYLFSKTKAFNLISWLLIFVELSGFILSCFLVDSIRHTLDRERLFDSN